MRFLNVKPANVVLMKQEV